MSSRPLFFFALFVQLLLTAKIIAQDNVHAIWAFGAGGINAPSEFSDDEGHTIVSDESGNVFIAGRYSNHLQLDPSGIITPLDAFVVYNTFLAKYDSSGNYLWGLGIPESNGINYASTIIALDDSGNLVITGTFTGVADFDPSEDTAWYNSAAGNTFIAKFSGNGQFLWNKQFGGGIKPYGLQLNSLNEVCITGMLSYSGDFDPSANVVTLSNSNLNIFMAKYSSEGEYQWAYQFGSFDHDYGQGIALMENDDIIITGVFRHSVDFDPSGDQALLNSGSYSGIFIAQYHSNGDYVASRALHSFSGVAGIKAQNENIFIAGNFSSTLSVDYPSDSVILNGTNTNMFILKYNSGLDLLSATELGSNDFNRVGDLALDQSGNILLAGDFTGEIDFAPGEQEELFSSTGRMGFLAKYDADGGFIWAETFPSTNSNILSVNVTNNNGILITGYFKDSIHIPVQNNSMALYGLSGNDIFAAHLRECGSTASLTFIACRSFLSPAGRLLTASGNYTDTIVNIAGCDSVIFIDLTITDH